MKVIILGIFLSTSLISFSQENSEKKSETNKVVKKEKPKNGTVKAKFDKDGNVIKRNKKIKATF